MKAVLIGKVRRSGVSKAGKNYDFTACSVCYDAYGVEGQQVAEVLVQSSMLAFDAFVVGDCYDFDFDNRGNLLNVFIED